MAEARSMVRGESERLRVGYLASAGQEYLGPALTALRRLHPEVNPTFSTRVKTGDFSGGVGCIKKRKLHSGCSADQGSSQRDK
jgi:hypothetical protein